MEIFHIQEYAPLCWRASKSVDVLQSDEAPQYSHAAFTSDKEEWESSVEQFICITVRRPVHFKFQINDSVRISKVKRTFEKGYLPNWTEEIFTITERIPRQPPVYRLKDYSGELLEGVFYEAELQKVEKADMFTLSKKC